MKTLANQLLPSSVDFSKALLGLVMYSASQTAQCAYCIAHSCSFALRRGLSPDVFQGNTSPKQKAVIALGEALSIIPANLTSNLISELRTYFNDSELEQFALSIGMMGFLNKFMDAKHPQRYHRWLQSVYSKE